MSRVPQIRLVRRKGRTPWYTLEVRGKRHHLGTDAQAAHREAARLLQGIDTPRPETAHGLIVAWLQEHPADRPWLQPWWDFVEDVLLEEFPVDSLERFARHLKRRGLAPATIRKYVRYATRVCHWAVEQGYLTQIPKRPKLAKPLEYPRDVDPRILQAAFDDLPTGAWRILSFMIATGCRPSEACRIRWDQINLQRAVCILPAHKTGSATGKPRTIYLTPAALRILKEQPRDRAHVFVNRRGKPYKPSGLRSILRRRGINSVYALRHTAAQSWLDQGVPLEDVARLLGHRDLRTVQVYAQVRDARARQVASALVSPLQTQPTADDAGTAGSAPRRKDRRRRAPSRRKRATGTGG
jgi:integrase